MMGGGGRVAGPCLLSSQSSRAGDEIGEGTEQPTWPTFCWRHSPSHLRTTLTHVIGVNSGRVEAELDEDGKQESKAQPLDDMQRGAASWRQQVTAQHCTLPSPAHHRDHLRLSSTYEVGSTREQQGIKNEMREGEGVINISQVSLRLCTIGANPNLSEPALALSYTQILTDNPLGNSHIPG